jgi:UDP-N-acetylglucosamine 2-epimerase (non-hydrolysing)
MKIMSVVGARPNFMKAAPIINAIEEHNQRMSSGPLGRVGTSSETIEHIFVHTGQHYDRLMSDNFFADLNLPHPDVHLGVGSGSHAGQTADIMRKFEGVLLQDQPDVLVLVGDVNSTLACALVAAKISFDDAGRRPLIAHVEAGLRSFDRRMPEEINRILTDQVSDLLFVTEESGLRNLSSEGISADKVHFVGNTMIDSLLAYREKAETSTILKDLGLCEPGGCSGTGQTPRPYVLLTLHRPANVDNCEAVSNILEGLSDLAREYIVVFPAHPRTQKRIREFGLERYFIGAEEITEVNCGGATGMIRIIDPLGYLDFLALMKGARMVVTDSGGIQEETTCLGIPCVTVRENTERPITLKNGSNVLAGVTAAGIRTAVKGQLVRAFQNELPQMWDGKAAFRILDIVLATAEKKICVSC